MVYLHGRNAIGASASSRIKIKHPERTWITKAEAENFYLLFPKAKRYKSTVPGTSNFIGFWNNGNTSPADLLYSDVNKTDDSKFIRKVTERVISNQCIAPCQVYVSGHSNGGGMAHRMTVDHDNLFSAVGVVANYNHQTPPTGATTPYPVPTHVIIGNNDQFVAKALGKTVPMSMNVSSSLFDVGSPLVSAAPSYAFYHNNSTTRTQKYILGSPVPFPFIGIDIYLSAIRS